MKRYVLKAEGNLFHLLETEGPIRKKLRGEEICRLLNQAQEDRKAYFSEISALQEYHKEMKKLLHKLIKRQEKSLAQHSGPSTQIKERGELKVTTKTLKEHINGE